MSKLTDSAEWKALETHLEDISHLHMRDMFRDNPQRFEQFSVRLGDLLLDYSKTALPKKQWKN